MISQSKQLKLFDQPDLPLPSFEDVASMDGVESSGLISQLLESIAACKESGDYENMARLCRSLKDFMKLGQDERKINTPKRHEHAHAHVDAGGIDLSSIASKFGLQGISERSGQTMSEDSGGDQEPSRIIIPGSERRDGPRQQLIIPVTYEREDEQHEAVPY